MSYSRSPDSPRHPPPNSHISYFHSHTGTSKGAGMVQADYVCVKLGSRYNSEGICRGFGSAYGIRTRDLRLERAVSLATRRTRHASGQLSVAGDRGFEPRLTDPESVVLPLDESPPSIAVYQESASRIKAVRGGSTALQTREPPIPSTGSIPGRPGEEVRAPIGYHGIGGRVWVCPPALERPRRGGLSRRPRMAGVRQPLLQFAKQQPYELLAAALCAAAIQVGGAAGAFVVVGYRL